ncbi:hypothetical protein EI94DRAFT_1698100 [Lactarius quietus]|nr:hypothetical protein EI94DRAFT_1698100 [Lactarius quietus]
MKAPALAPTSTAPPPPSPEQSPAKRDSPKQTIPPPLTSPPDALQDFPGLDENQVEEIFKDTESKIERRDTDKWKDILESTPVTEENLACTANNSRAMCSTPWKLGNKPGSCLHPMTGQDMKSNQPMKHVELRK